MTPAYYRDLFQLIREVTCRAVEIMPDDRMDFQPPHSRSFAEILLHMVDAQYRILNDATGREDTPPKPLTRASYPTKASLVELMRAEQARVCEVIDAMTQETLDQLRPNPFGGEGPRSLWLHILIAHESDHKGNLVMMAKVCGVHPPDVMALRPPPGQA